MQLALERRGNALFAISAGGVEHLARFIDADHLVVAGEKDPRGCCYRLERYGATILAMHEADIVLETEERLESIGCCTLPDASYQQSPHSEAVHALVKEVCAPQKQEPAPAAPPPQPAPHDPPRRSRGPAKRHDHAGLERNPNPCPECGTPRYQGNCPNCN